MQNNSNSYFELILFEASAVFASIKELDTPRKITGLFKDLGYELPGSGLFAFEFSSLAALITEIDDLRRQYETSSPVRKLELIGRLLVKVENIVGELKSEIDSFRDLPEFVEKSSFKEEFFQRLFDFLLFKHLIQNKPQ
ncbi:MAG: hypothetical protein AAF564_02830, partial [Bacteroidota bacterium]